MIRRKNIEKAPAAGDAIHLGQLDITSDPETDVDGNANGRNTYLHIPDAASNPSGASAGCVYYKTGTGLMQHDGSSFAAVGAAAYSLDAAYAVGAEIDGCTSTGTAVEIGDGTDSMLFYTNSNVPTITTDGGSNLVLNSAGGNVSVLSTNFVVGASALSVASATGAITGGSGADIALNTTMFTVDAGTGDVGVGNDLTVGNDATISGDLGVTGTATIGTLAITAIQSAANLTINAATGANTITIGNLSTGGITVSDNVTFSQPVRVSSTNDISFNAATELIYSSAAGQLDIDAATEVEIATATLDVNAGTAINMDSAAFSIDATSSSNVSVTGGDLQLYSLTSGDVDINAAEDFLVDAGAVISIDGVGNSNITIDTGDLVLATTTSGTLDMNAVANFTLDAGGTISLDGVGNSNVTAASGNLTLATTTSGDVIASAAAALDFDAAAASNITVTSANMSIVTATSGNIILTSAGILDFDGVGASHMVIDSGDLNLQTTTSGDIDINSVAALDFDCVACTFDSTGGLTMALSGAASSITSTNQNLSLVTATSGNLILTSAGILDVDCVGNSHIVTDSGGMNIQTTTSGDIDINSVAALDIDCVAATVDITGGMDMNLSGAGSSITSAGQALTIETTTSGNITIQSGGTDSVIIDGAAIQFQGRHENNQATTTVDSGDGVIYYTTAGSANATTLPDISTEYGFDLTFYFLADGGQDVVIGRAGTDTISVSSGDLLNTSITMNDAGDHCVLRAVAPAVWLVVEESGTTVA